ncbi:MAG: extracellular solute-binding protein [Treponema sp.]|jgi:raffinose/stachyose/melibiose transport system substrate-binding protein|nr:extracellular solute-binding protein [Treponema sp.]
MLKSFHFLAAVSIAAVILAFFGCSGDDSGRADPATLRVLNYFDPASPNAAEETALVWDAFGEANPHIAIIREDLYGESYYDRLETYIREENLPDLIFAWPGGRSVPLHTGGFLKDLSALAARDKLQDRYSSAALDGRFQAGGILGVLPASLSFAHVFYVNTAVLSELGLRPARTYDELKAQVPLLNAAGYGTALLGNQDSWVMQRCLFSLVAGRFCGQGWEQRILSGEWSFTRGDFMDALEFIRSLYADGVIARSTLLIDCREAAKQFAENRAAYLIDGDWRARDLLALLPERQGDIRLALFPDIAGTTLNRSASVSPGPGWAINVKVPEKSAQERAAWRLALWLTGGETQARLLASGAISAPSRLDIDEEALNLPPLRKGMAALVRDFETGAPAIDQIFPEAVWVPLNDGLQELGMGTKTSGEVARTVQTAFDAWKTR